MEITPIMGILIGVTTILVSVLKKVVKDKTLYPVASLLIGVGLSLLFIQGALVSVVLQGFVIGLSASGLYSTAVKPAKRSVDGFRKSYR